MENRLLNFKVSTHLKDIIGKDLVTDKYVAIFELVKNSVDARANNIEVTINSNEIIIKDDGKGMTLEEIENKWLFIGYSEKKDSKETYAGNKGIGRFSADNLAKRLRIETSANCSNSKVTVDIDWEDFEKNQKDEIGGISIPYKIDKNSNKKGTTLFLSELRSFWTEQDIAKLRRALEKLENPFEEKKSTKISLISNYIDLNGVIKNTLREVLDEKSIVMNVKIKNDRFECSLYHNDNMVVMFSYKQKTILEEVNFSIYHLTPAAKSNFTRRMGIDFTNYGNIFVYRNGFRIYPYGEIDYDIFQLNFRKTQGHSRYLGSRDIIGSISIKDTKSKFKEVSSRDNGFVTNPSYLELQKNYMEFHRFLESFMKLSLFNTTMNYNINKSIIRRFMGKEAFEYELGKNQEYVKVSDVLKKIEKDIPLSIVEKRVIQDENRRSKIETLQVNDIKKENRELLKKNVNLEKEIAIKNILIDSNDDNVGVGREMFNHHINTEINELKAIMKNFKLENESLISTHSFIEFERSYYASINKLNAIKSIVFSVKENSIGKSRNNIVHFINDYSMNWSKRNKTKINVYTNEIVFEKNYDIIYLVIILDNLFENAIKNGAHKIDITFDKDDNGLKMDVISRESVKNDIDLNRVFDFGYTTRRRGTGMGLYFVKKIVEEQFEDSISVNIINGIDFVISVLMR